MKKVFTLLTLALMSIGSAWAADGDNQLIKEVDFTSSAWADCRAALKIANGTTVDGCTANGDLAITAAGEMNFADANMSTGGANALAIPLSGINGSIKIVLTSTEANVRCNWFLAEGTAECTARNGTAAGTTTINYSMTTDATTGTLYIGRRGSADKIAITKIQVYTADASATNELTEVTINGTAISASDLSTLTSTKALTDGTAYSGLPTVKYTVTSKSGGEVTGTEVLDGTVEEDGDNYKCTISISGVSYVITFTNVIIEEVLNVTGTTTVELTKANIISKGYLEVSTDDWNKGKTYDGITGDFYNMSTNSRTITIKVKGAKFFNLFVQNSNAGRGYTVKIDDGDAVTVGHEGSGVEASGLFEIADPSAETTITIAGTGSSVYPVKVEFYTATISAAITSEGWATFCTSAPLDFSGVTGLKAYIVTGYEGTAITTTQMTGTVPANTPLLLEGATTDIPVVASSSTDVSANKLVAGPGSNVISKPDKTRYVLSAEAGVAVFKKINATDAFVPKDKAYLEFAEVIAAPMLSMGGETTGINAVNGEGFTVNGEYFNLAGQRVAQPTKGLYIVNGRKVVIK